MSLKLATNSLLSEKSIEKTLLMELEVLGFLVLAEVSIHNDPNGNPVECSWEIISIDGSGEAALPCMEVLDAAIADRLVMAILRYLNKRLTAGDSNEQN